MIDYAEIKAKATFDQRHPDAGPDGWYELSVDAQNRYRILSGGKAVTLPDVRPVCRGEGRGMRATG